MGSYFNDLLRLSLVLVSYFFRNCNCLSNVNKSRLMWSRWMFHFWSGPKWSQSKWFTIWQRDWLISTSKTCVLTYISLSDNNNKNRNNNKFLNLEIAKQVLVATNRLKILVWHFEHVNSRDVVKKVKTKFLFSQFLTKHLHLTLLIPVTKFWWK